MPRSMKLKVDRLTLLNRVRKAKLAAETAHEAETSKWATKVLAYEETRKETGKAVAEALREAAKAALTGKLPRAENLWLSSRQQHHICVPFPKLPTPPGEAPKLDTRRFARHISLLEMCNDETIAVGTDDDFGVYL